MIIHKGYENLQFRNPIITMGVFDGVHLGHRMLLGRVTDLARERGSDAVAVTFDPHPRLVLTGDPSHLKFLTDIDERVRLLGETGIGHVVIVEFTRELSGMTACGFLSEILCRHLGVSHLITGFNHHFGKRQEGTSDTIMDCAGKMNFSVSREEALVIDGTPVSSSRIRTLLAGGDVMKASELLGYYYTVTGKVVPGRKIGRGLGFPTANIEPLFPYKLIPGDGVYAVEIEAEGYPGWRHGMVNIGTNPTISESDGQRTLEAYIIDFDGDLYGRVLSIRFRFRLRDEIRYDTVDELVIQMKADLARAVSLLGK